jgi:RimJ/RimL family protein N-acetyltransferase
VAIPTDPLLIEVPEVLRGERVLVRPFADADAPALFEAIEESRQHLAPWMPWVHAYGSVENGLEYIRRSRAHWLLRERLPVGIFEVNSGALLGGSGLERINWDIPRFEIGYWLRLSAQGQGYIQEVVRLLTRMAFDDLHAKRVVILMDPRNTRSKRVPERLGFVFEGTLRNSAVDNNTGLPADRHVYALIPEDYAKLEWARDPSTVNTSPAHR